MTLKYNELQDLVLPKVSIDEFSPKTGDNNDVIVNADKDIKHNEII